MKIKQYFDKPSWWIVKADGNLLCYSSFETRAAAIDWMIEQGY